MLIALLILLAMPLAALNLFCFKWLRAVYMLRRASQRLGRMTPAELQSLLDQWQSGSVESPSRGGMTN